MAILMSYSCSRSSCNFRSSTSLDDAQRHADTTGHTVNIEGEVTERPNPVASVRDIDAAARKKMEEAHILRIARDRGLTKTGPIRREEPVRPDPFIEGIQNRRNP